MKWSITVTKISLTPHRARKAPGTAPKTAPPAKPATSTSGSMSACGSAPPTANARPVATMAPAYIWPSTPMLKKPPSSARCDRSRRGRGRRHAGHQASDGIGVEPLPWEVGDDRAAEHHHDAMTKLGQLVQVLGDQQHAAVPLREGQAAAPYRFRRARIEPTRRIGGHEESAANCPRLGHRARDQDFLDVAARELCGPRVFTPDGDRVVADGLTRERAHPTLVERDASAERER